MNLEPLIRDVQQRLKDRGRKVTVDGDAGLETWSAIAVELGVTNEPKYPTSAVGFNTSRMTPIEVVDPTWEWLSGKVFRDGDDLVIISTIATAFGGDDDPMDDGTTACGFNTKGHSDLIGCALPLRHDAIHDRRHGFVLRNSPIPMMPFGLDAKGRDNPLGAHVDLVFSNGLKVDYVPVIDLGPANWTKHAIDLTIALARRKVANATANNFEDRVSFRIRGAAKFLKA